MSHPYQAYQTLVCLRKHAVMSNLKLGQKSRQKADKVKLLFVLYLMGGLCLTGGGTCDVWIPEPCA